MRVFPTGTRFIRALFLAGALLSAAVPFADGAERFNRKTPLVLAVQKVGPSVVNIYTEEVTQAPGNPFRNFGNNVFDQFFRDFFPNLDNQRRSLGSGVIINPEGYILTNEHVIGKAVRIKVTLIDKREYDAQLVGADRNSDLAVIKIQPKEALPYVKMGVSNDLMIGETVLAIGNPYGLQHTVTTGIISALNRSIQAGKNLTYHDFIQVDASINPGNSGGPLLNINGSLIGINTAIYQKAEGIGFAIPIDNAKRIINDLIHFGKVRRGWLGVFVQDMTPDLVRYYKLDRPRGVLVRKVFQESPAKRIGIRRGDLILKLDDHEIKDRLEYNQRLASYSIGNNITFSVWRDGRERDFRLKIKAIPRKRVSEFVRSWLGFWAQGINENATRKYRLRTRKGVVVVQVVPDGPADRIGIQQGDVIRQVNQKKIHRFEDFTKAVVDGGYRDSALLLVQRGKSGYYVTLQP